MIGIDIVSWQTAGINMAIACVFSAETRSISDELFFHLNLPYIFTQEMLIAKQQSTRYWTHTDFPSVRRYGVWNGSVQETRNCNMALNLYRIVNCYISYFDIEIQHMMSVCSDLSA
jgi:hypothetical protein